jgi:hypothetical protein
MRVHLKDTMLNVLGMVLNLMLGPVSPTKPPARQAVPTYEVKVEDNNILVRKQQ